MTEAFGAILAAVLLVLLSMVGGGIIYLLIKDYIKSQIRRD